MLLKQFQFPFAEKEARKLKAPVFLQHQTDLYKNSDLQMAYQEFHEE